MSKLWSSNFPYFINVAPVNPVVTLDEVKEWLKLDPADASQDGLLTLLVEAATICCEQITRRTLITTTFFTSRNSFGPVIELKRSRFQAIVSFKYTVSGSLVDVDSSLFYTTLEKDYSSIILKVDESYPTDGDNILQGIQIKFTAGFGDDGTDVPTNLRVAILNHITALYENRGDCDAASIEKSLPNTSRFIYNKYRILEMTNG